MKATKTFYCIAFLLACCLWVFLSVLVKQYLIDKEFYTQGAKFILAGVLFICFYFTYRWFGKYSAIKKK